MTGNQLLRCMRRSAIWLAAWHWENDIWEDHIKKYLMWLKNPIVLFIYYFVFLAVAFSLLPKFHHALQISGNTWLVSLFMALVLTLLHHFVFKKNK
jgi:hypothetical protein